jgi:single-stranded DNA-binding protein
MSAHVLISGVLYRQPEQRTSRAGKSFVTATLRCKEGDASQWWKVLAFSESAGVELLRLGDGDAVSVQGVLRVETYDKDGETRLSLSVVADAVLALKQPPRQREKKSAARSDTRPRAHRIAGDGVDVFGDAAPF